MSMTGEKLSDYRAQYRQSFISPTYNGKLHFAFTVSFSLLVILASLLQLENVTMLQWLTIPITFLYANFAEWAGHRFAMHRKRKIAGLVYTRHTLQHHRFFTHQHMDIDSIADYKAVLFPPILVTFFLLVFFVPFGLALTWVFGTNVAWLGVATGMGYFLNYELLHWSYHQPAGHWVHAIPGHAKLKKLHTDHHDPSLMAHKNFNISYPITDWIMKTWYRG